MTDFDFDVDYFVNNEAIEIDRKASNLVDQYGIGAILTALERKGMAVRAVYQNQKWHKPRVITL